MHFGTFCEKLMYILQVLDYFLKDILSREKNFNTKI